MEKAFPGDGSADAKALLWEMSLPYSSNSKQASRAGMQLARGRGVRGEVEMRAAVVLGRVLSLDFILSAMRSHRGVLNRG